jgi:hypothetical protein
MAKDTNMDSGRIYAAVERYNATEARPEGFTGILAIDPDRGDWSPVVERQEIPRGLQLVRKGTRLGFSDGQTDTRLWIIDRPWDSPARQVARLCGYGSHPLSESGEEFFVALRGPDARDAGVDGVWQIAANGTDRVRLPLSEEESIHDCSPDGQWLLVGRGAIELVTPSGSEVRNLTPAGQVCIRPRFSPDGRRIAYARSTHDGESLWVVDIDTGQPSLILTEAPVTIVARWSPDGSRLALKLLGCVRGPKGWMSVPADEAWRMRPSLEILSLSGGDRQLLVLPPGYINLGAWG